MTEENDNEGAEPSPTQSPRASGRRLLLRGALRTVAGTVLSGAAFGGSARATEADNLAVAPADGIQVKIALPRPYAADGSDGGPPGLDGRARATPFYVVIENVSPAPLHVWPEISLMGYLRVSFLVTIPGRPETVIRRIGDAYGKTSLHTERLAPGDCQVRAIYFANPEDWEPLPFVPGKRLDVELRAVFEQPAVEIPLPPNVPLWQGRSVSAVLRVGLFTP